MRERREHAATAATGDVALATIRVRTVGTVRPADAVAYGGVVAGMDGSPMDDTLFGSPQQIRSRVFL